MALKKIGTGAHEFESEDGGAAVAVEETVTQSGASEVLRSSESAVIAAEEVASSAIQVAQKNAVGSASKYRPALEELKNVIDPFTVDFDTFTRITVGLDGFSDENEDVIGKKIKVRLMSWNERFVISPGVQNTEANELTRYSLDGKTIDGTNQTVESYLTALQETEGYPDASVKRYYTLYGFLLATSETGSDMVEIPEEDQQIVAIQIPPRSVAKFSGYQIQRGVKESMGKVAPSDELVLTSNKVKGKSVTYAEILFSAK